MSLPPEMTGYCPDGAVLDPAAVSRVAIGADGTLMKVVSGAGPLSPP